MADERKLIIVGTGSQARYVIENLGRNGRARIAGLVDLERRENVGEVINGVEVLCPIDELDLDPTSHDAIVAYGDNRKKRDVVARLAAQGFGFASAVSAHAYVSDFVKIGPGCIVNPHAVIMPNARLGSHVIVHSHCTVEHDDVLEDYSNVAPGVSLAGNVTVGEGSYLYTGANVLPNVTIGSWAVVGAGATVLEDVPDHQVAVGVPARPIAGR